MKDIKKQKFICLDCESTGLDPKKDRIIEFAAMKFDLSNTFESIDLLIDPQCDIPESSIAIHGINNDMVKGKPSIDMVLPEILAFVSDDIIVGHGIPYDIEIIANECIRFNVPHSIRQNRLIDTLRLARLYGDSPKNSLENLRKHFNIKFEGAHRAMNDVIVNVEVFRYLSKKFKTVDQIFNALSKPIKLKVMPFGKYKGRNMKDIPLDYLRRSLQKLSLDRDLSFTIRSEIQHRNKGTLFTQKTNPFLDL